MEKKREGQFYIDMIFLGVPFCFNIFIFLKGLKGEKWEGIGWETFAKKYLPLPLFKQKCQFLHSLRRTQP